MEEYIGWYVRKGVLAVERLLGQGAICIKAGDLFKLQFHSKDLPMCDTHSLTAANNTAVAYVMASLDSTIRKAWELTQQGQKSYF